MKMSFAIRVTFEAYGQHFVRYTFTDDLTRIRQKVQSLCPTAHIHEFKNVDTTYVDINKKML